MHTWEDEITTALRKGMEIVAPHLLPAVPVYAIDAPSGSGAGSSEATLFNWTI